MVVCLYSLNGFQNTSGLNQEYRLPRLWNSLPVIDLTLSFNTIKQQLKSYLWEHFKSCPSGEQYHTCSWQLTCSNVTVRRVCDQIPACSSGCFCSRRTVLINGVCSNASLCSVYLPNITNPLENTTTAIAEGDTMTITCGVLGYPPPTIIWSKTNGTLSNRASMSISTTTFIGSSRLPYVRRNVTFTNFYREDTGSYQCRANNSASIATRSLIIIQDCPSGKEYRTCSWQLTCSNLTVHRVCDQIPACSNGCFCSGHTVLINGVCSNASLCSDCPSGKEYRTFSWQLTCSNLTVHRVCDQIPAFSNGCFCSGHTVLINGVCSNASLCSVYLPNITNPLENTTTAIAEGDTMTITCGVLGYPPPTIIWSKTNGTLSNRVSMSISTTTFVGSSRLPYVRRNVTFTNFYREDTGSYQCRANNSAGIDTRSLIIIQELIPDGGAASSSQSSNTVLIIGITVVLVTTLLTVVIIVVTVYCRRKPTSGSTPRVSKMTKAPTIKHNPIFGETDQADGESLHLYDELVNYEDIILSTNPAYQETIPKSTQKKFFEESDSAVTTEEINSNKGKVSEESGYAVTAEKMNSNKGKVSEESGYAVTAEKMNSNKGKVSEESGYAVTAEKMNSNKRKVSEESGYVVTAEEMNSNKRKVSKERGYVVTVEEINEAESDYVCLRQE
ncbi:leucine-rich repeats and immunoglobulin-like domains protein 1 [Dysidea avara]|uniref:leucine-rich repeats and immunoglobulin-like domains protein 1 n=1 Tax=Dysidea avara TaxID=196820 RepID=UPI00331F008B